MSRLNDLLYQLRGKEPDLAQELQREFAALADRRAFGLNFERHVPEAVELPGRKVRKGDKVLVLPPRGEISERPDGRLWKVLGVDRGSGVAMLEILGTTVAKRGEQPLETTNAAVDDLVVVAEFRDPIYPGLVSTGRLERGGGKPFHTVINAENFHALETLLFTHRGKIDCIYIDPPYNTGAKDWKYNNNYVEVDDLYRHSKWLAMMERRLLLAKELLKPDDSVLIVTIDEKEVHRLGLLIQQVFPDAKTQMVSAVVNPAGTSREGLARVDEHLFFAFVGGAAPARVPDNLLFEVPASEKLPWLTLIRGGSQWRRQSRRNLCYPIFVDRSTAEIVGVGDPFADEDESQRITSEGNLDYAWPVRSDGKLGIWRVNGEKLMSLVTSGFAYASKYDEDRGTWSVHYLQSGTVKGITSGSLEVARSGDGRFVELVKGFSTGHVAKTVWNRPSHNAGRHGSELLRLMIPGRKFPFPKSLYAVEDALRIATADKPAAVVLDFFAGSGTTAHAVMRLNKQDGGFRRSILVTNNEVAADEQKSLRQANLRPGDPDWEELGICEHITKPRIESAVTGLTPEGDLMKGDYKFTDEFPMAEGFEENVEFFTLTYEAPLRVASHREFTRIAPLLWMRAGQRGRRIDDISSGWDVADNYGVLADLDQTEVFLKAIVANEDATVAFIVTDEDRLFESVSQELPSHVEPVRLYESYLRNFEIDSGRGSL